MGMMTTITILNDIWQVIKDNPKEFIDVIQEGMEGNNPYYRMFEGEPAFKPINNYGIKNCANGIEIAHSHHADVPALFLTWHNGMYTFGCDNDGIRDLKLRKKLLKIARNEIRLEADRIKELENEQKNKMKEEFDFV